MGVSGGPDSVALLDALVALGYRPHVCHLNHRWRGEESDADAEFVRQLAARYGLPATIEARKAPQSEDGARRARFAFFERVARKTGLRTLLLAHTADDQVETFLLRLLRGAGPSGLSGIWPERPIGSLLVIRPLLSVWRPQILAYLRRRKLTWREDTSNANPRFLRNRVRHQLLPLLARDYNPGIRRVLWRTAEILRAEAAGEPVGFQRRAIRDALGPLEFCAVEKLRRRLFRHWPVKLKGRTVIPELGLCVQAQIVKPARGSLSKRGDRKTSEVLDAAAIGRRPFIRTWQPGDRFQPLGMHSQKKLQDFFVDEKVPRVQRCWVPLLCAQDKRIAWVVGYRIGEPFKVTEKTRRAVRFRVRFLGSSGLSSAR